jgi:hypothetical protein
MIPHPPKWVRAALVELNRSSGSQESLSSLWIVRLSSHYASSGYFGILRSLRDLLPLPAGPPRVSRHSDRPRPKPWYNRPRDLVLSSRALAQELVSPLGDPSSREIHSQPVFPPADIPPVRLLPGAETPFGSTVPPAESRSAFVVSHHHDGLLRTEVTGLLHPATGQGFAAFRASQYQSSPKAILDTVGSPREAIHTLRRVSLVRSRSASLRPLPSCRYRPPPGTPAGRSQKTHRPSPTEAEIGRPCALPPRRVSARPIVSSRPSPEGAGRPSTPKPAPRLPKELVCRPRDGASLTAEAQDETRMR